MWQLSAAVCIPRNVNLKSGHAFLISILFQYQKDALALNGLAVPPLIGFI